MHRCSAALALALVLPALVSAEPPKPKLEELRKELAVRYGEPAPHMALARYYHDKGNRLQAFLVLEYARRHLFPGEMFDQAYEGAFIHSEPFDNSEKAEAALLKKHAEDPKSADVAVKLADIYISRDEWTKAKEYLEKAIKLKPDQFDNVAALAEVLRRDRKPKEADKLVRDYLDNHPQSPEAYKRKIEPLMKKDPEAAKKLIAEAIEKHPKEGVFAFNMGVLLQNDQKLKDAEEHFLKAAALAKDSAHIHGWAGRFFLKVKEDDGKALEFYLNAYFLDPHFYDSEYAEQRIRKIGSALAKKKYDKLVEDGKKPEEIIRDENPLVAAMALKTIEQEWDGKYQKPVLEALTYDDETVRALALQALIKNADKSFDKELKALLNDSDLRKRGLSAYLAVKLWGDEGIKEIKPWLKEDAQLLRYDAISALLQYGGPKGREIVKEHHANEKHPWLKKWLDAVSGDK